MEYYVISLVKAAAIAAALLTTLAYLQWAERKILGHVQRRLGPYRTGPHGLLQPLADVIKLITKEDLIPPHVNKVLFLAAPFLAVTMALLSIAVIPLGGEVEVLGRKTWMQLTDLNIGVLFILAAASMGVYGIALAGWSSNNKYALLGGLRSSAQMISYELPMSLALAAPLLLLNTLSLREVVEAQTGFAFGFLPRWTVFQWPAPQVVSYIIFIISGFAETNRVPFDLPEAENELVAGFHTEYSSMKFAAFFMAEYCNMITLAAMTTTLFLGGWLPIFPAKFGSDFVAPAIFVAAAAVAFYHGFNPARERDRLTLPVVGVLLVGIASLFFVPALRQFVQPLFWFGAKCGMILFGFIWVRGTSPRLRYDQLMGFAWKFLFPFSMLNLLITSLLVALFSE